MKLKELFTDTGQLTRITILTGILLVVAVLSFAGYYYYDRYSGSPQPDQQEMTLAHAEQAVRDDPASVEKRMALAETYMFNMRYEDALLQANQVMAVEPENQRAWLVIGVANANTGKPADALDPLTKFVVARQDQEMPGLDKALHAAAFFLGDSYLQLGKPMEAIEPLTKAVEWSQTDADAMYKLGLAYSGVGDYPQAVYMFHMAATFVPDYTEVYDSMAAAYDAGGQQEYGDYARGMSAYSKKDYQKAIDLLNKAAQAHPDFAPNFSGLGLVYEAVEKLQDAKTAYQTAIQLDPGNFTAKNGSERVEKLINK